MSDDEPQIEQSQHFNDSSEATDFIADFSEMLNDPRLANWFEVTDQNYHKRLAAKFAQLRVGLNDLIDELDGCD